MVITGLTRNQFAGNRTWVRIPPAPPFVDLDALKRWGYFNFQIIKKIFCGDK